MGDTSDTRSCNLQEFSAHTRLPYVFACVMTGIMQEPWLGQAPPLPATEDCLHVVDPAPALRAPPALFCVPLPPVANQKVLEFLRGSTPMDLAVRLRLGLDIYLDKHAKMRAILGNL